METNELNELQEKDELYRQEMLKPAPSPLTTAQLAPVLYLRYFLTQRKSKRQNKGARWRMRNTSLPRFIAPGSPPERVCRHFDEMLADDVEGT